MTIAFEILKLIGQGIELGCKFVFGLLLIAVVCGFCTAAAGAGWYWLGLLILLGGAGYCGCSFVCKIFPYKRLLRSSSLGYLGLLCAFGMAGAGFLYGITLTSGHIR
jgi:hypothetical protein